MEPSLLPTDRQLLKLLGWLAAEPGEGREVIKFDELMGLVRQMGWAG